jgi:glycosyltransferase involved in cell wall biosynthesis
VLIDPDDEAALADAAIAAATDPETRRRLIAAGRERAARFTWQRAAEETDRLVGELLRG